MARQFTGRMRERGLSEDAGSPVICRWRHAATGLVLDAMPADPSILGFANRWQAATLPHAARRTLPSGAEIRAATPPYLIATKLEAFSGRGRGDLLASHDLEDVIALIDGREELIGEVETGPAELRSFVAGQLDAVRADPCLGGCSAMPRKQRSATLVCVLAYAGLRPGEALGLAWRHVRQSTLLVEQAVSDGRLKRQKTGRIYCAVYLVAPLAGDLARWRTASGFAGPGRLRLRALKGRRDPCAGIGSARPLLRHASTPAGPPQPTRCCHSVARRPVPPRGSL